MAKKTNNNLTNVPCQKRWSFCTHFHKIFHVVTKYNYFFEMPIFMKKDNFIRKYTKAKENVRCIVKIEKKMKKMLSYTK